MAFVEIIKQRVRKHRAYFEMAALFLLIFAVGFVLNSADPFFCRFRPSPYVLVVLLMAMKYGSPLGLISGIICAVIELLALTMFNLTVLKDSIYFEPQILFSPLVYIAIGHYVGEAVHSSLKRNEFSRKLAMESKNISASLSGEKADIEKRYRQLESKIASESKSNFSLMRSFNRFDVLEPEVIAEYAIELCEKFSGAEKVEYWRKRKGNWERMAPSWASVNYPPAMALKAIEEEVIATSRDYPLAAQNDGGDMALYIKCGDEEIHTIVCFGIPFVQWGLNLGDTLRIILREAVNAHSIWSLKLALGETAPIEKKLRVENYKVFKHQVRRQLLTLSRSQKISSVVFIRVAGELARDIRILGIVASALNSLLRISDGVSYLHETKRFMIFLPETPLVGAKIVLKKVNAALETVNIIVDGDKINLLVDYVELKNAQEFEDAWDKYNKAG